MQYSTSFLTVNGIWRELLIVTSASPIPEYPNGIVTDTGDHYETVYHTEGLFRSFVDGGKHINWYLIRSKGVKERAVVALMSKQAEFEATISLTIEAIGDLAEMEYNKAMEVIGNV